MNIEVEDTGLRILRCAGCACVYVQRYSRSHREWLLVSCHGSTAEAMAAASGYTF